MADPFTTGLLAVTAANNPTVAADALSLIGGDSGMALPFGGASLGQFLGGFGQDPTGGLIPQQGGVAGGIGLPQGALGFGGPSFLGGPQGAPGQQQGQSPLAGLQGFKGPEAVKPELAGGIRGAQGAPQQNPAGLQTDPIMQLLQQLLQGGGPPPLGTLLGGRQ